MTRPEQYLHLGELLAYVEQVICHGIPGNVWVKAELAAINDRRHLYFELLETGDEQAKCRATLWANKRYKLESKLKKATGQGFVVGMQVYLFCSVEFHIQYGFSLSIEDVASEVAIGEASLQYQAMRQQLIAEEIYHQNHRLPLPTDIYRLAVISPSQAAGLEDFRQEIDPLTARGLLDMNYFQATFQGQAAARELLTALSAAKEEHQSTPLDALVILRGGGATVDLAWLNQLEIARAVATFPVPVITGLGHNRDNTLLDEVAAIRSDTPSKAAQWLTNLLRQSTERAAADYQQIVQVGKHILQDSQQLSQQQKERIEQAAQQVVQQAEKDSQNLLQQLLSLGVNSTLQRGYAIVRNSAGKVISSASQLSQLQQGQQLRLQLQDGNALVTVAALNTETNTKSDRDSAAT